MAFMDDLVKLWDGIRVCFCTWPIKQIRRTSCFNDLTANGYCSVFVATKDENNNDDDERRVDSAV